MMNDGSHPKSRFIAEDIQTREMSRRTYSLAELRALKETPLARHMPPELEEIMASKDTILLFVVFLFARKTIKNLDFCLHLSMLPCLSLYDPALKVRRLAKDEADPILSPKKPPIGGVKSVFGAQRTSAPRLRLCSCLI